MLVRYYEAGLGRFISADPSGKCTQDHDVQSWNSYAYVGNNPMRFIDPNGEVKFATTDAQAAYTEARDYLDHSSASHGVMTSLESLGGPYEPTVQLNSNGLTQYDASANIIHWDPNSGGDVSNQNGQPDSGGGAVQTPALGLAHEADHAVRRNTDTAGYKTDAQPGTDKQYGTKEEKRVVTGSETAAAKELDEPTRKTAGGKPTPTQGPTVKK